MIEQIGIVGAGTMGNGIAQVCAAAGLPVVMSDISDAALTRGMSVVSNSLERSDFKRYLDRNAGTDLAQLTPEVASAMLDQFIEEIIVSEHAASHGVEVPAEGPAVLELVYP